MIFPKKFRLSLLLACLPFAGLLAQRPVSCQALISFVENRALLYSVNYGSNMGSPWLEEVRLYNLNDELYVWARIREDEFDTNGKKYLYCNVPQSNWNNFLFGREWDSESYGIRFNYYIVPFECDCF
jgi:hypothetical protein